MPAGSTWRSSWITDFIPEFEPPRVLICSINRPNELLTNSCESCRSSSHESSTPARRIVHASVSKEVWTTGRNRSERNGSLSPKSRWRFRCMRIRFKLRCNNVPTVPSSRFVQGPFLPAFCTWPPPRSVVHQPDMPLPFLLRISA